MNSEIVNDLPNSKPAFPRKSLVLLGVLALMVVLMACLSVGSASAAGPTYAYDDIASGTTNWTEEGSPYIVNASFTVETGATLNIGPNVTVLCDPNVVITVNGTLVADGTADKMVTFTTNQTGSMWGGLSFANTSVGSMLDFARLDNASHAVSVNDCTVPITNCMFLDGRNPAIMFTLTKSAPIMVTGCTFNYLDTNAINIRQSVTTIDTESAVLNGPITITENDFSGYGRAVYIYRMVNAQNSSSASITGDMLIQSNQMNITPGNWNTIYYEAYLYSYADANATVQGDLIVSDNTLVQTGYRFVYSYMYMRSYGENSTVTYDGDIGVCDNTMADPDGNVLYNSVDCISTGYSDINLISDVTVSGNTVEYCSSNGVEIYSNIRSYDNSTVDVMRDMTVSGNTFGHVYSLLNYNLGVLVYDDSVVTFNGEVRFADNIVDVLSDYGMRYVFNENGFDNGEFTYDGGINIVGNALNASDDAAFLFSINLGATQDAKSFMDAPICINGNTVTVENDGFFLFSASVSAQMDAQAELTGDVTVTGNTVTMHNDDYTGIWLSRTVQTTVNGTATISGEFLIDGNDFLGDCYNGVQLSDVITTGTENGTACLIGDLVVTDNTFEDCAANGVFHTYSISGVGYSDIAYASDLIVMDNSVEQVNGYAVYVTQTVSIQDYAEATVVSNTEIVSNTVESADLLGASADIKGLLRCDGSYAADDESVLDFVGDVCVLDNVCEYPDGTMVHFNVDGDADDMASVTIQNALTVTGNNASVANGVIYVANIDASESAGIEANMPLTVTCNTFTVGASMVEADVDCSVWENATAVLRNDVLVQGNSMESGYFDMIVAPAGPGYSGYGLKLFQYLSVDADGVLASATIESEVLFDDNTIEGYNIVGMNVYRNAKAEASFADAVACIVGDVTATNNVLSISGIGCGLAGGAEVYAYEFAGNASATVNTLFCISQNTLTMEDGHGIVAYARDNGYDYEDEYNTEISTLAIEFVIENNCIYGIETEGIGAPVITEPLIGLYVDANMGVPVLVSENTFDMEEGTAIVILSGEVTVINNDIVVEYGTGIRIEGGNVVVEKNSIEASVYGIWVKGDGVVLKDNTITMTQGTGMLFASADDAVIQDNIITGATVGLRLNDCFNVSVLRNAINNNDIGVWASETGNLSFCNNWVVYNNQNGAQFYSCWNLWIEYNLFANNQGDGAYISGDHTTPTARDGDENPWTVVGNNTFDQNWNDGLEVNDCDILIIYNGVYTDNTDYGLYVYQCIEAKWIVDGVSEVRNNNVLLYGADLYVQAGGKLTLDYVPYFAIGAYGTDMLIPVEFGDEKAKIDIDLGGEMVARNTEFYAYSGNYFFNVYGTLEMMDCYVSGIVQLYIAEGSTVLLDSSTISDASRNCITIDNSSPVIRACIIRNANMDGIFIEGADAKPVIKDCLIYNNERGIYARNTCLDKVIDNIFLSNYMAGIYAENVTGAIHDNVFLFNHKEIFVIDSTVTVEDNQIGYSRLLDQASPYASVIMTVVMDMLKVNVNIDIADLINNERSVAPGATVPGTDMLMDAIVNMMMDDHMGIYCVGSTVYASGNEYGSLQYAVYAIDSTVVFKDTVKTNYFTLSWYGENGTKYAFDLPFYVYDGIFATNSDVTVTGASIQCLDDAIFLEGCTAEIADTTFDAGDFDIYIMEGSVIGVHGCNWEKIKVLDTSAMFVENLLTLTVKDQDGFAISGASVNITDAAGKVWATGVSDGKGVFKVFLPNYAILADGLQNTSINPFTASATKDGNTGSGNFVMDDKATAAGVTVAIKKNSVFGMDPLVIGGIALVIAVILIGALYFARKK